MYNDLKSEEEHTQLTQINIRNELKAFVAYFKDSMNKHGRRLAYLYCQMNWLNENVDFKNYYNKDVIKSVKGCVPSIIGEAVETLLNKYLSKYKYWHSKFIPNIQQYFNYEENFNEINKILKKKPIIICIDDVKDTGHTVIGIDIDDHCINYKDSNKQKLQVLDLKNFDGNLKFIDFNPYGNRNFPEPIINSPKPIINVPEPIPVPIEYRS